ncbi:Replication protein A 14 kDa subunit [Camponotus japonicus]
MSDIRTLGKRLVQRVGQEAIVLGRITGKSSDGKSAEITTTDDARINVTFPEFLDDDASGYVEIRGIIKSKSTMSCSNFVLFPLNMTKDFDLNGYNTMMNMRCAVGNQLEGVFYKD